MKISIVASIAVIDFDYKILNEWFKLEADDVETFMEYCINDLSDYVKYLESKLIDNSVSFERLKNWLD